MFEHGADIVDEIIVEGDYCVASVPANNKWYIIGGKYEYGRWNWIRVEEWHSRPQTYTLRDLLGKLISGMMGGSSPEYTFHREAWAAIRTRLEKAAGRPTSSYYGW